MDFHQNVRHVLAYPYTEVCIPPYTFQPLCLSFILNGPQSVSAYPSTSPYLLYPCLKNKQGKNYMPLAVELQFWPATFHIQHCRPQEAQRATPIRHITTHIKTMLAIVRMHIIRLCLYILSGIHKGSVASFLPRWRGDFPTVFS